MKPFYVFCSKYEKLLQKTQRKVFRSFLYVLYALIFTACGKNQIQSPAKPLVWVTIPPYQFFVEKIGADYVEVRSIVPPGADAHCFEATPRQREMIQSGQIWFCIGEPFEKTLQTTFQKLTIVDLRDNVELIGEDRHIWMSPDAVKKQAAQIAKVLSERFPAHRDEFAAHLQSLVADLDILDAEIRQVLVQKRVLLVSHPAFGYFCRDYGLEQLSVEFEGKEPRPQYLKFILQQQRPDVAISLPQHNNKGVLVVAEKFQLPIKMIDPYAYDYFSMMRELTKWICN